MIMLAKLGRNQSQEYRQNMLYQINRAFAKVDKPLKVGTVRLVDQLVDLGKPEPDAAVLCVGCRNMVEINYLEARGLINVRGIDLFSLNPQIQVMDMHDMKFQDHQFDVIYSSHSLEHSQDLKRVIGEFMRVAKPGALVALEVPIHYRTTKTDMIDFGSAERLADAFKPHIEKIVFSEEQPLHSQTNDLGTDIARLIFTVR
jgi:SAM-dependent methyltransferase